MMNAFIMEVAAEIIASAVIAGCGFVYSYVKNNVNKD